MVLRSTLIALLKLCIASILAAWACVWILRPTQLWKKSWHKAEDWADTTFLRESGLNVIVYCFPLLFVAAIGFVYLHLCSKGTKIQKRTCLVTNLSNPIIIRSPIGILSSSELIAAALFIVFLVWTCYSNVSSDLKKILPSKSLPLNKWQFKVMSLGVRFGSLSEASLALLFLPILRQMSLFNIFGIQFEASIRYHVCLGNAVVLFSVLHGTIIMSVWGSKNNLVIEITRWQTTGCVYLAGAINLAIVLIIWITSLPQIRRKNFQFFYLAHHLYILFIILFLLHAGAGHFYLVFAGVLLFALDKILRIVQSRGETCLISARILPCKAIELTLPKVPSMHFTPTSTLFVKIPSISKFQWHPFSITSKLEDDRLSLIVKCQGPWTNSLYDRIQSVQNAASNESRNLCMATEGPYGPLDFPYKRYNSLILVAGGSGITPILSILQDVASRNERRNEYPKKIQLVYTVKKAKDLSMLTPIAPLRFNQEEEVIPVTFKIFITQEEASSTVVGELLDEMSQVKNIIFDQRSYAYGVQNPKGNLLKAAIIGLASIVFLASLVCLTHVFTPQQKRSSKNKSPSWISDLLVVCSFVIATSCSTTLIALLYMRWKSMKDYDEPKASNKSFRSSEMHPERFQDLLGKTDISFGKRPNLEDIILEQSTEEEESNVGVFVCGPDSMQESVASFCRKNPRRCGKKNKCFYTFHSFNFSL